MYTLEAFFALLAALLVMPFPAAPAKAEPTKAKGLISISSIITPVQFGAKGDGITNDTATIKAFFDACNTTTLVCDGLGKTYLVNYVVNQPTISRNGTILQNITLKGTPGGSATTMLLIDAPNVTLNNVTIDGNMSAMTSSSQGATYCLLVDYTANYQRWNNVTVKYCNSQDAVYMAPNGAAPHGGSTGHQINGLYLYHNSGSGLEMGGTSYSVFSKLVADYNGFGYQKNAPFPINRSTPLKTDIGFGAALRFQSHDIQFVNGKFNNSGRDGLNFNQGTHDILVTNTQANFNGDGGFTLAADSTAPGFPGDAQPPRNIRLSNDFGQGNYTAGAVAYSAVAGLTINGGAYWNNSRVQGDLAQTSSFFNNIYIPAGSRDAYIKTKAYDDRQTATVTSSGSCTFTVNRWVPGTYRYYPKVAFYNPGGAFEGYGQISAENSTRLTTTTLPHNSVKCADISTGWMVTQRVTHNGAFLDRGSTGRLDVSGRGFLIGPNPAIQGHVELVIK